MGDVTFSSCLFVYMFRLSKVGRMVGSESFFVFLIYHFPVILIQVQVIQSGFQ